MNTQDLYGRSPIRENTRHTHHAIGINLQAAAGIYRKLNIVAHAQEIQHGAFQHQNTKEASYTCTQPYHTSHGRHSKTEFRVIYSGVPRARERSNIAKTNLVTCPSKKFCYSRDRTSDRPTARLSVCTTGKAM